ncbi:MAG: hypothetical protein PHD81_02160 [Candidatus Nanoarchaeia archaeon]|nr:hypothetical protein [Candidatus Nanoarchaeia archaeon]MDD5587894.1 hypothetical protein [Candidatus Nanoarchaeia archaeon]
MQSRKGIETLTVILIIFLLSMVLLSYVTYKFIEQGEGIASTATCRTSVELKAKAKLGGLGQLLGVDIPLNCPASYLLIENKKDAKEQIAEEMYDCYYKYGEGKIDFMDDYSFSGKEIQCFLCSKITFKKEEFKDQEITDFGKYFLEEGYAQDMYNIQNEAGITKAGLNSIPTKNPIYLLFVADKRKNVLETLKTNENVFLSGCLGGTIIGGEIGSAFAIVGAVPGAIGGCFAGGVAYSAALLTSYTSYTYWTDSEDLVNLCSGKDTEKNK